MTTCAVDGCDTKACCRGWCDKHYHRWRVTGDPQQTMKKGPAPKPTIDRLMDKVIQADDDCWLYQGSLQKNGYGYVTFGHSGKLRAHRVSYEFFIADIPDELEIDHLCNRRNCVNPWHMEVVTHAENIRRGTDRLWRDRTECSRGHQLKDGDVMTIQGAKDGWIARQCRRCYHENNSNPAKLERQKAARR